MTDVGATPMAEPNARTRAVARVMGTRLGRSMQGEGLRAKAMRGSGWTVIGYGAGQALRLGSNLILTRLLFPEAFGLMALASVFMAGLQMFSDLGIGPSVVQNKKGAEPDFLNTAWTIQIFRGFSLWIIACLIAYPVSVVYKHPVMFPLLCTIGAGAAIQGFRTIDYALSSRKISLERITVVDLASHAFGLVILVSWASVDPSVWALAGGGLANALLSVIIAHRFVGKHRHRLQIDTECAREIFGFGKWIFISSAITFVSMSGDRAILPKIFSMPDLAFYGIALMLVEVPSQLLQRVSGGVLFPVFAQLVRDGNRTGIKKTITKFSIISSPIYSIPIALMFWGEAAILFLYDSRYSTAGGLVSILAIGGFFRMLKSTQEGLLLATGRTRNHMLTNASRFLVWLPLSILLARPWGLEGFCVGIVVADAVAFLVQRFFVGRALPDIRTSIDLAALVTLLIGVAGVCLLMTR